MKAYYEDSHATIYHGDAREVLPDIAVADLVITDPPYVFGLASTNQEGKAGGWGDLMNNAVFYASWMRECARFMQNRNGAMWIFNSWRSFPVLARASFEISWPITSLLVWDKEWIGPGGPVGLRPSYEMVALFAANDFRLANRGLPDIWRSKWSSRKPSGHPAEKPEPLVRRLISESGGGLVLDPFMGPGTTLRAAKNLARKGIGIEIEERWCEVAAKRLGQEMLPGVVR